MYKINPYFVKSTTKCSREKDCSVYKFDMLIRFVLFKRYIVRICNIDLKKPYIED